MRAITVRQPWATAIAAAVLVPDLAKTVENRGRPWPWRDAIGERVAIHAGKGWEQDAIHLGEGPWLPLLEALVALSVRGDDRYRDGYPTALLLPWMLRDTHRAGVVLCTAVLVDVHECDGDCSPWAQPDQWHLVFAEHELVKDAESVDGALGWWEWAA